MTTCLHATVAVKAATCGEVQPLNVMQLVRTAARMKLSFLLSFLQIIIRTLALQVFSEDLCFFFYFVSPVQPSSMFFSCVARSCCTCPSLSCPTHCIYNYSLVSVSSYSACPCCSPAGGLSCMAVVLCLLSVSLFCCHVNFLFCL